jgi:hypothetical protein
MKIFYIYVWRALFLELLFTPLTGQLLSTEKMILTD